MKLFWLIPHFTGEERNRDKEKFNNLFKARQISRQVPQPLDSRPIFFPLCQFSSRVTLAWLRLSFRRVSTNN